MQLIRFFPTFFATLLLTNSLSAADTVDLALITEPSGARVDYVIDGASARLPEATPALAGFPLGARVELTFSLDGYEPSTHTFVVTREFPGLDIRLTPLGHTAPLVLVTRPGATVWARQPGGAEVELGTVDLAGRLELTYGDLRARLGLPEPDSPFVLRVAASGFAARELPELRFGEEAQEVEVTLAATGKMLRFTSSPVGARVLLNGEPIGLTPFELELKWSGTGVFRAELPGHQSLERSLAFDDVRTTPHAVEFTGFERVAGELTLNLLLPGRRPLPAEVRSELQVFVNNNLHTLEGSRLIGVGMGRLRLLILHDGFLPVERDYRLEAEVGSLEIEMEPRDAVVQLTFEQKVDYAVTVDGEAVSVLPGGYVLVPGFRPVTLAVSFGGQAGPTREFNLPGGSQVQWEIEAPEIAPVVPAVPRERQGPITLPDLNLALAWVPTDGGGFWTGVTEVTQGQYRAVMGTNPSLVHEVRQPDTQRTETVPRTIIRMVSGRPTRVTVYDEVTVTVPGEVTQLTDHPVENVSWANALAFCERLNSREALRRLVPEGYEFRLPTAEEWTVAYGPHRFVSGATDAELARHAWYAANSNARHRPVRGLRPNARGLHDMAGNVAEWTAEIAPRAEAGTNWAARFHQPRTRGGAFNQAAAACAVDAVGPESAPAGHIGFRIVLAPKAERLAR